MNENMDKKPLEKIDEAEVAGGKVIESKDGKFYVVSDNSMPFSTEEDAKSAEKMLISRPRPLPIMLPKKPIMPYHPMPQKNFMNKKMDKNPQDPINTMDIKPEIK